MRINEPYSISEGDIIICPRCHKSQAKCVMRLQYGMKMKASDFHPVDGSPGFHDTKPCVCYECGEALLGQKRDGGLVFRAIQRRTK